MLRDAQMKGIASGKHVISWIMTSRETFSCFLTDGAGTVRCPVWRLPCLLGSHQERILGGFPGGLVKTDLEALTCQEAGSHPAFRPSHPSISWSEFFQILHGTSPGNSLNWFFLESSLFGLYKSTCTRVFVDLVGMCTGVITTSSPYEIWDGNQSRSRWT